MHVCSAFSEAAKDLIRKLLTPDKTKRFGERAGASRAVLRVCGPRAANWRAWRVRPPLTRVPVCPAPPRHPSAGCLRGGASDIKAHPWFAKVVWDDVFHCRVPAPFVPRVRSAKDTSNFDSYPDSDEETPSAKRLAPKEEALFDEFDGY